MGQMGPVQMPPKIPIRKDTNDFSFLLFKSSITIRTLDFFNVKIYNFICTADASWKCNK